MLHRRTHPQDVEDCFLCRIGGGPYVGAAVRVTQAGANQVREADARQAKWDRDGAAYKSLRDDGIQPAHLDGAADLMQRSDSVEQIVTGKADVPEASFRAFEDTFGHKVTEVV